MTSEHQRLEEARSGIPWREWGPYLSERQWGTVREDYSDSGDAWGYFSHDQSRSRVYRRGEDGLAGISDGKQRLCFALALWNGRDPILKERLFGLSNGEGNHGEDVKEYYYYLDSTPTHSYMRYLYKYPQSEFPYNDLTETNRNRSRDMAEYELIDTGVFNDDRYFDVFVEYAKADPEDLLIRITIKNRSDRAASLHVLPTLWFRNTWFREDGAPKPSIGVQNDAAGSAALLATHPTLGRRWLYCEGNPEAIFCDNETNNARLFGVPNDVPFVKDGIGEYVVHGHSEAINPARTGTKAAAHYLVEVPAQGEVVLRLRMRARQCDRGANAAFGAAFDETFRQRKQEADEFYASVLPKNLNDDRAEIARQALAGMLWSKQYYFFDMQDYLAERGVEAMGHSERVRNSDWFHMVNDDIISMPDKWEYPWYAAWDLAFHTVALSMVDLDFAKSQLDLMVSELYLHPNGQLPAYEWNFGDVNPPVHAWAALFLYHTEQAQRGKGDKGFLARIFSRLVMNFTWWVNRKDRHGRNVFEGGFLGLDNISVFDRSKPLPDGGCLEQADGTAWMAFFCQNMLEICVELAGDSDVFDRLAVKYVDHFFWIAGGMNQSGPTGMWDEEDGFYYDVLRLPNGRSERLKVRSLVGLLPLCATTIVEPSQRGKLPGMAAHIHQRFQHVPKLRDCMHPLGAKGYGDRGMIALVTPERLRRILTRVLDENEFLSPYGIRSISRYHLDHPYVFRENGQELRVDYQPAESASAMYGGNSNWRGPVWMPINVLITRALLHFHMYYGDEFRIECPTGSGKRMNLFEVAHEINERLTRIFVRDPATGHRPVFGGQAKFQTDPHFRDHILFYEYFHGDNGAGIGASHQTGWTGLVAKLIELSSTLSARSTLEWGRAAAFRNLDDIAPSRANGPGSTMSAAENAAGEVFLADSRLRSYARCLTRRRIESDRRARPPTTSRS
ncbi:MAG: glucosidase [Polyangiaceae bacterium]